MTQIEMPKRVDPPWKVQERRCRRKAQRQGLVVQRRMRMAQMWIATEAGPYQVFDPSTRKVVAGEPGRGGLDLDAVEAFLDGAAR